MSKGKFDLHVHTKYSKCGLESPEKILEQAKELKLAGIAITDHDLAKSFPDFKSLLKEKGIIVVFGEEVSIIEGGKCFGHLLCYFLQEEIKPASFGEIIDAAKSQNALTSIAHAFDFARTGFRKDLGKEFQKLDAIEAFNGRARLGDANKKAREFAEKHKMPFTAGSDAHALAEIGNAGIECEASSEEELRQAILKKKCGIFGKKTTSPIMQTYYSAIARLRH
ncbi:MAG: PHP domain-containing protein [Candidatus Diapherotrites archaeon]|uniref:PHP domain-containing protein n=1 Tax=Candidatus Iainarchaeum sp. TaxID=3101447 RepID=A0A8T4KXB6_9ARCH|nr:MAG: hypothetical protein QT12_C0028G0006 [archaeon GW2011_AR21]MBS3058787.1 PHP domain-containing protein [Candidatus Diapherotrites archaeon]